MARVTGIGGVFFRAQDPDKLYAWYEQHLGIQRSADGSVIFQWNEDAGGPPHRETHEYGKFAWVRDPEGNVIELWEPPAGE